MLWPLLDDRSVCAAMVCHRDMYKAMKYYTVRTALTPQQLAKYQRVTPRVTHLLVDSDSLSDIEWPPTLTDVTWSAETAVLHAGELPDGLLSLSIPGEFFDFDLDDFPRSLTYLRLPNTWYTEKPMPALSLTELVFGYDDGMSYAPAGCRQD